MVAFFSLCVYVGIGVRASIYFFDTKDLNIWQNCGMLDGILKKNEHVVIYCLSYSCAKSPK